MDLLSTTELEQHLPEILNQFRDKTVVYCCNYGNAGDAIIHEAQMQLFVKAKINFNIMSCRDVVSNQIILYSGGGNLNDLYKDCALFLKNNTKPELNNTIYLLPHTVEGRVALLKDLPDSVYIICREQGTLDHVLKHFPHKKNVLISHDAAFYFDIPELLNRSYRQAEIENPKTLYCLRNDLERKNHPNLTPINNDDISASTPGQNALFGPVRTKCAIKFVEKIELYDRIITNRLHVAIIAGLMGRQVELYSNSYHKNKSMYEFSFKRFGLDKYVTFIQ